MKLPRRSGAGRLSCRLLDERKVTTTLLGAPLAANSDSCVQGTPTQVSTVSSSAGHPEVLVVGYCHGGHWYIGELAG